MGIRRSRSKSFLQRLWRSTSLSPSSKRFMGRAFWQYSLRRSIDPFGFKVQLSRAVPPDFYLQPGARRVRLPRDLCRRLILQWALETRHQSHDPLCTETLVMKQRFRFALSQMGVALQRLWIV